MTTTATPATITAKPAERFIVQLLSALLNDSGSDKCKQSGHQPEESPKDGTHDNQQHARIDSRRCTLHELRIVLRIHREECRVHRGDPNTVNDACQKSMQKVFARCASGNQPCVDDENCEPEQWLDHPQTKQRANGHRETKKRKRKNEFPIHRRRSSYFANAAIGPSGLIMSLIAEYGTSTCCGPAA